ncbi:hypothetical protein CDL15_Pgr024735 [Punica granatum]|uniref:Uncharacterized protein n=1 Tax=Punica granatum TaxID=22663 RepID=A0A218W5T7_PUNGR|nr:hypothetical protein CDL15_Pgr024735 [Punica granatum]
MGAQVLEHGHSGALACVVGAPGGVWARAGTGTLTGGRGCGYNRALGVRGRVLEHARAVSRH